MYYKHWHRILLSILHCVLSSNMLHQFISFKRNSILLQSCGSQWVIRYLIIIAPCRPTLPLHQALGYLMYCRDVKDNNFESRISHTKLWLTRRRRLPVEFKHLKWKQNYDYLLLFTGYRRLVVICTASILNTDLEAGASYGSITTWHNIITINKNWNYQFKCRSIESSLFEHLMRVVSLKLWLIVLMHYYDRILQ